MRIKNGKGALNKAPVAVVVNNAATLLAAANTERVQTLIVNNSSQTVYLGRDATVTTGNGIPLTAGATATDDSIDDIYAIVAASTSDVRVMESL